uniref:NB-ARC domain-containing protein n=1 Tax=Oryza meridionalis TaxID=40149 RepID=A0A0E0EBD9_9ORYZ
MRQVLALSYNYLPSHLKPCFLYLSIFPEDFEIQRKRLVYRWIAEGFIRARKGVSIMDVAIKYFNELINRSLIQPSRVNISGTIKSCRVHDIMRDIMISISREEKFMIKKLVRWRKNIRHVAYYNSNSSEIAMDLNQVRSLTVFCERPKELTPLLCSPQVRMLRVLDFQGVRFGMTQKEMDNIGSVLHLKYMNIRCDYDFPNNFNGHSKIYRIPRSIGKLQGLRVLDISNTYITSLPTEICKLRSLNVLRCTREERYKFFDPSKPIQCLFALSCIPVTMSLADSDQRREVTAELHMACSSCWFRTNGVRVPRGIGNLKQLQELVGMDISQTSSKAVKELGELSRLRKLRLETNGATERKCKMLCAAIENLSSLGYLRIRAFRFTDCSLTSLEWLHSISSPPPFLKSFTLFGCIKEIDIGWLRELTHLVKIELGGSELKEGKTVEILGELPNLMVLRLLWDAYVGVKLFRADAFAKLRKLDITYLDNLRHMRFEERTSPRMETIDISFCRLESGIIGIKHLQKLKEISLSWNCEVARLGQLQEEVEANPNHPVLRMSEDPSDHDLGDTEGSATQVEANDPLPKNVGESSQSNQGDDDDSDQQQPITSTEIMPADADPAASS